MSERIAGARYAFRAAHPASPMLRVRYRHGVPVDPWGFPDWTPYARVMVALPPAIADLTVEEARVVDVRTADRVARAGGDPLWDGAVGTPVGWTWAHTAQTRHLALVPAELHASFRHLGGVSVGARTLSGHGLVAPGTEPPGILVTERLTDAALDAADERFGVRLPPHYRDFLGRTNGGAPSFPAVLPGFGFVLDQPLFGFREDRTHDLGYLNAFFGDRLTEDWLAIGLVQGGLLALRIRGRDAGAVGYLDDDDPRDRDHFTAADVCDRLLHRVAGDFASFWLALRAVPSDVDDLAAGAAATAVLAAPEGLGSLLPASHRRPA
ncbi:SMI1/KNR4 family protein [Actinoplanes oblitus]|uniref:SMI1/KNR4 family protein n=1 Tax=Actinoplanes oblitus TaxID=3040509 RepID=A0ABY8WLN5_9ACTN|nr:SMI1/KNR4 family protein [Actinoplanes oblitus]WIM97998.1 SMI1/KNR4 family protein [Actinoplanes oblitus]